MNSDSYYARMADRRERDPYSEDKGRASVPMGRGFELYRRFNPTAELIWLTDAYGQERAITRKQADVLDLALTYIDHGTFTMRQLASELKVSPSTVSRALVKLASFGLIGYLTGRGRYCGTVIFKRFQGDGLERYAKMAREKLRRWKQAAEARLLRLEINVASRYSWKEKEGRESLTNYYELLLTKDATLNRSWSKEELQELGL